MSDHSVQVPGVRASRLLRISVSHLLSAVVSGLVAGAGMAALAGQPSMGVPWTVAGLGGLAGSVVVLVAALLARRAVGDDPADVSRYAPAARLARLVMLVAAVATAATGVLLAPGGVDRGFSIAVTVGLAVTLALFALLDNDLGREIRRAG